MRKIQGICVPYALNLLSQIKGLTKLKVYSVNRRIKIDSQKLFPKKFEKPKKTFFLNHDFFPSKSWNRGKFTKLVLENHHEIAGITNCEITKCGTPCTIVDDAISIFKSLHFARICIWNSLCPKQSFGE